MAIAAILPFIAVAASVAGAGIAAYGAYQQGQAAKTAGNYNATVADQNAEIAQQQASAQAEQDKRAAILRLGEARASYGASGVTVSGSPLDVLGDIASQSELQRQQTLYQGQLAARAQRTTAASERFGGAAASRAGALSAGAGLLSGAASAYKDYAMLSRPGGTLSTAPKNPGFS